MNYSKLTDEREQWRRTLEAGGLLDIYVLQQYRLFRSSNLWRSTREVEKLCETILFLEGAKPMSEVTTIKCDQCQDDITKGSEQQAYRLRLIEELRPIEQPTGEYPKPELSQQLHFCHLAHLKEWINAQP